VKERAERTSHNASKKANVAVYLMILETALWSGRHCLTFRLEKVKSGLLGFCYLDEAMEFEKREIG
jgi:hypothetical protein